MMRSIAAVGDVSSESTWSGTPWSFWTAASLSGFAPTPWTINIEALKLPRLLWNLKRVLQGKEIGGFQYSKPFIDLLERQALPEWKQSEVITFHQHFPRSTTIKKAGGKINHYVDAPFVALASGRGLDLKLPADITQKALEAERENYSLSERVITMGRWAADVIRAECGVNDTKIHTVLPGANMSLPAQWQFPDFRPGAGKTRDFVLGFVGKDWARKGLPLLLSLRDELARRGWRVVVHAAGLPQDTFKAQCGLEHAGYINKTKNPEKFIEFLARCDLGCLFSEHEALGISTLEFLRAGIPVAGFAHEGMADTLPPDAGFRFDPESSCCEIADELELYLRDEAKQFEFHQHARRWSPLVSWERCILEFEELWETSTLQKPVRPWLGLSEQPSILFS